MDHHDGGSGSGGVSADGFRVFLARVTGSVEEEVNAELMKQARLLVTAIQAAAPARSGRLRESVRIERGKSSDTVVVRAGGPLTTKPVRNGAKATYDYSLATEFGTTHEAAEPFFYSTYRQKRRGMRTAVNAAVNRAVKGA